MSANNNPKKNINISVKSITGPLTIMYWQNMKFILIFDTNQKVERANKPEMRYSNHEVNLSTYQYAGSEAQRLAGGCVI